MSRESSGAPENLSTKGCPDGFPEFWLQIQTDFQFLIDEYGFKEPHFKTAPRECWVSFQNDDIEIEIGYEPLSLPWGFVTRYLDSEVARMSITELMEKYAFHLAEDKYREFDQARERLFALLESPDEADEYARNAKEHFDRGVAEWVRDLASFFKEHLPEIQSSIISWPN